MADRVPLNVDGRAHEVAVDDPDMPLLYALRDDLGLDNPRFGCGLGQCGACTVLVDGAPTRSCITPVGMVRGQSIVTLNGLGSPDRPHRVQAAFAAEAVSQCGYCVNGWILTAVALLERTPHPGEGEIRDALAGLKCRCGTHMAVLRAIKRAAAA